MKIQIINGPNLNLLGTREPDVYGTTSFNDYYLQLQDDFEFADFEYFQSNVEGEIINKLHEVGFTFDYIILNAGGYSHTSVAIADAVASVKTPVIEVHISNIFNREEYRKVLPISAKSAGLISGFGLDSYRIAIQACATMHAKRGR